MLLACEMMARTVIWKTFWIALRKNILQLLYRNISGMQKNEMKRSVQLFYRKEVWLLLCFKIQLFYNLSPSFSTLFKVITLASVNSLFLQTQMLSCIAKPMTLDHEKISQTVYSYQFPWREEKIKLTHHAIMLNKFYDQVDCSAEYHFLLYNYQS